MLSSSSSFSHSSSSSALKCPPPRTEGVNKVMGDAHHPTGYILWGSVTFRPIQITERRGSLGGAWGKSACLRSRSRGLPFLFLFNENKNSFSRKGVLRTKPAESILPVPGPLNAYEPSKMVVSCCYYSFPLLRSTLYSMNIHPEPLREK